MKTTGRFLAGIAGMMLASSATAAGLWGGSPFGGLSPFGSSPFSSFSSPFGFGGSPLSMLNPWGGGLSPWGYGTSPYSPYSPFSPFSPFGGGMFPLSSSSGLMSRGLEMPFAGGGLPFGTMPPMYPYGQMASPYSLYGMQAYNYGLPPMSSPYTPYLLPSVPGAVTAAPLPY